MAVCAQDRAKIERGRWGLHENGNGPLSRSLYPANTIVAEAFVMLLERRLRPRVPCVAVAIIAVILSAVSLTIRADGARSSQLVDLPGPFPESVNTGPDIIHMQSVELSAEAQVVSRSDYWYQQSTGLYKEENRQAGEEVLSATAYTGDRLLGFDRVSGYAAEYTIGAYRSSFLATEFDPQRDYRNRASALAEEARLAIDSGQLIRETEELRDGRHTVLYRTADDQVKVTTWLVVDDMTGLPVEERVSRSSDASIITSRAYDYEVIPASSAPVGLFEMTLSPGITPRTDEDLPVDPAGLEVSAAEAARECAFNVFWLGDRYDGVPLQIVRVTPDRSAATVYYGNNYGSPQANSQGPRTSASTSSHRPNSLMIS